MHESGIADGDNTEEYQHELEFSEEKKLRTRNDVELRSYLEYQQHYGEQNAWNVEIMFRKGTFYIKRDRTRTATANHWGTHCLDISIKWNIAPTILTYL